MYMYVYKCTNMKTLFNMLIKAREHNHTTERQTHNWPEKSENWLAQVGT